MNNPIYMPEGPWTYHPYEDGAPVVGPWGRICDLDCTVYPDEATDEEIETLDAERDAHGRLIAALPDMLEACRMLCAWAEAQGDSAEAEEIMTNAIAMAASAMSKAQQGA